MTSLKAFKKYTESGIVPPLNSIGLLFFAIVLFAILGFFYNIVMWFMPIVYLNAVVIFVYGYIIAHLSRYLNIVFKICLLYTSPSPRDLSTSRMPSSA